MGAGYGGLNQLYLLRDKGLKVKVVEATSRLGGVWYWNNYPGLRVDTMNPMYDLNIDEVNKDWTWSEKFSSRDEILRYNNKIHNQVKILSIRKMYMNDMSFIYYLFIYIISLFIHLLFNLFNCHIIDCLFF